MKSHTVLPPRQKEAPALEPPSAVERALLDIPSAIRDAAPEVHVETPPRATEFDCIIHRHESGPMVRLIKSVRISVLK